MPGAARRTFGGCHRQPEYQDRHPKPRGRVREAQKIKGRKRPLLVDTLGLIVAVVVTAAHVDDRQGLTALLNHYCAPGVTRLRTLWVDGGYRAAWLHAWVWSLKRTHKIDLEVVEHTGKGFQVVPYRWVVDRSHL
jgi:transposase